MDSSKNPSNLENSADAMGSVNPENPANQPRNPLSKEERQRQTAAELVRRRVVMAYRGAKRVIKSGNGSLVKRQGTVARQRGVIPYQSVPRQNYNSDAATWNSQSVVDSVQTGSDNGADMGSYKNTPIQPGAVSKEDWQKYHTAWQNYYQQYYSEYYARAARRYIETEQMKTERARGDDELLLGVAEEDKGKAQPSLKERIRQKATDQARKTRRYRKFMPILAGVAVVLVVLFLQFNRLIFAPLAAYVSPGNMEGDEITAVDPLITRTVSAEPKLIIPKLNVEVPVHFGISNDNDTVMAAMNEGVAQFSISGANALPGQNGNLVITGHSAGDVYSNNQYKFIFSGLERLVEGDKICINYDSKQYTYVVTRMAMVEPTDLAALRETTGRPQLILVTCTPLGTSQYRLLVYADQVSPAVDGSEATPSSKSNGDSDELPANEPSFLDGVWNFLTNSS